MKRFLPLLAVIVVLAVGVRALIVSLASDETHIRWAIEGMVEGFDAGQAGTASAPLSPEWRHASPELDPGTLRTGLLRAFQEEREFRTGRRLLRVEVPQESLSIQVFDDRAVSEAEARFFRSRPGQEAWSEAWHVRIVAEWNRADDGWEIVKSSHEELGGPGLR